MASLRRMPYRQPAHLGTPCIRMLVIVKPDRTSLVTLRSSSSRKIVAEVLAPVYGSRVYFVYSNLSACRSNPT